MLNVGNMNVVCKMITWGIGASTHLFWVCLPGQRLMNFSEQEYYDALRMECIIFKVSHSVSILLMNTIRPSELDVMKTTLLKWKRSFWSLRLQYRTSRFSLQHFAKQCYCN